MKRKGRGERQNRDEKRIRKFLFWNTVEIENKDKNFWTTNNRHKKEMGKDLIEIRESNRNKRMELYYLV